MGDQEGCWIIESDWGGGGGGGGGNQEGHWIVGGVG